VMTAGDDGKETGVKITWPRDVFAAPLIGVLAALLFGASVTAGAQYVLPRPEQPFGGKIGRTTKESVKDFPKDVQAPKGAPNILLILTYDVGFGASSTFGGPIPTATMDRLANAGLRYTQFHTTALWGRNWRPAASPDFAQSWPESPQFSRSFLYAGPS